MSLCICIDVCTLSSAFSRTTLPISADPALYLHILRNYIGVTQPLRYHLERYEKCPQVGHPLNIDFCNIHCLKYNFLSVEHHLSSSKPRLRCLRLLIAGLILFLPTFPIVSFKPKVTVVYVPNDITCCRAYDLESSEIFITKT